MPAAQRLIRWGIRAGNNLARERHLQTAGAAVQRGRQAKSGNHSVVGQRGLRRQKSGYRTPHRSDGRLELNHGRGRGPAGTHGQIHNAHPPMLAVTATEPLPP